MEKGLLLWEKLWGLYVEKRIVAENKYCHTQTPSTWKQLRQAAATTRMQRKNLILQRQAELPFWRCVRAKRPLLCSLRQAALGDGPRPATGLVRRRAPNARRSAPPRVHMPPREACRPREEEAAAHPRRSSPTGYRRAKDRLAAASLAGPQPVAADARIRFRRRIAAASLLVRVRVAGGGGGGGGD